MAAEKSGPTSCFAASLVALKAPALHTVCGKDVYAGSTGENAFSDSRPAGKVRLSGGVEAVRSKSGIWAANAVT